MTPARLVTLLAVCLVLVTQPSSRPTSSRDGSRLAAERAFVEGSRLRAEEKESSSRQAIREFEAARRAWNAANDGRGEAERAQSDRGNASSAR